MGVSCHENITCLDVESIVSVIDSGVQGCGVWGCGVWWWYAWNSCYNKKQHITGSHKYYYNTPRPQHHILELPIDVSLRMCTHMYTRSTLASDRCYEMNCLPDILPSHDARRMCHRVFTSTIYIYIYIHTHVYIYIYREREIKVHIYIYTYIYIYIYIYICACLYAYIVYLHRCAYVCVCVYVYIYIYIGFFVVHPMPRVLRRRLCGCVVLCIYIYI